MMTRPRCAWMMVVMVILSLTVRGASTAQPEKLRFQLKGGNLVVVAVMINGVGPFQFVLDTGTSLTVISDVVARRVGFEETGSVKVATVTGLKTRQRGRIDTITLGRQTLNPAEVIVMGTGELSDWSASVDGILGQNVLNRLNYLIDYRSRELCFLALDADYPMMGGYKAGTSLRHGRLVVEVNPSTHAAPLRLMLDSGSSDILLFEPASKAMNLDVVRTNRFVQLNTPLGGTPMWQGQLRTFRIGGETFSNLPVTFAQGGLPAGTTVEHGLLPTSLFDAVYVNNREHFVVFNPSLKR